MRVRVTLVRLVAQAGRVDTIKMSAIRRMTGCLSEVRVVVFRDGMDVGARPALPCGYNVNM